MAFINKIEKTESYEMRGNVTSCRAEYNEFYHAGEKCVCILTFGSETRKKPNEPSQTIHLNKKIASQLVEYLKQSFDL